MHGCHVAGQIGAVLEKPLHASAEVVEAAQRVGFKNLDREQRNQTHDRTHLQRNALTLSVQHVIEESVVFIPQAER